jgi:hypothetical protein
VWKLVNVEQHVRAEQQFRAIHGCNTADDSA